MKTKNNVAVLILSSFITMGVNIPIFLIASVLVGTVLIICGNYLPKSRQNHPCPAVRVCPAGAIKQTGYKAPVIDQDKCSKCIRFCPMGAIKEE